MTWKSIISVTRNRTRLGMLLALLMPFPGLAFGQTQNISIPVDGGGTLTYQYEIQTSSCGGIQQNSAATWDSFSYISSGGTTTSLGGSIDYVYPCSYYQIDGGWDYLSNYDSSDDWSNELDLTPTVSINGQNCTIVFDASEYNPDGSASMSCAQTAIGYVDPKYIIVGVTYAPPGPSSNTFVQYTNSQLIGTTSSISSSFQTGVSSSVSLSHGLHIPEVASGTITTTYSTTATQSTSSTSTVTATMQSSSSFKTFGTSSYFEPVDHDYDIIWVWLNPAVILTVSSSSSSNSVVWDGYGYDGTDEPGMDIVGIPVGYLNGDFGAMPPDLTSALARTWANGQMMPAAQGPGLTSTDLATILAADPFSSRSYGLDDITYDPPDPETPDHRFTLASCDGVTTFNYKQGDPSATPNVSVCKLSYTNMSTQAQSQSSMISKAFSVDASFSGTAFFLKLSADLKRAYSFSWTTGAQNSITSSTTSSAQLSIQGPPCNNSTPGVGPCIPVYDSAGDEPTKFAVYQDNLYGTFMLAPVHYYQ